FVRKGAWVRIPPVPPFMEPGESGIRKAALGNMPVACCNRRGFSAENESHPFRQIFYLAETGRKNHENCIT
ncbi:MAG: hypothetical protein UDM04_01070, partial [Agathobaculum sp.]|nr:hypothetical protein [Agathobaculum sp.]